jgi:hypothetical protein
LLTDGDIFRNEKNVPKGGRHDYVINFYLENWKESVKFGIVRHTLRLFPRCAIVVKRREKEIAD